VREEAEAAGRRGEALGKEVEALTGERADLRAQVPHLEDTIFVTLMTSDRNLKATREGSKCRIYGT